MDRSVVWGVAGLAILAVMVRPWRLPVAVWPLAGALILLVAGILPFDDVMQGARAGTDVYLFLLGMMLLAEIAREEGLFDWLATVAARHANGSPQRLFALIYTVGTVVTIFLSNDATAVVLTPAVATVTRAMRVEKPQSYLLVCAFVANAASFVLPISNPANLVIYAKHLPHLIEWMPRFALPSLLSIVATYGVLYWNQRSHLPTTLARDVPDSPLSRGGKATGLGIIAVALALMGASAAGADLGLPTLLAGLVTVAVVSIATRRFHWQWVKHISWGVLPLVAGLFVLVRALDDAGWVDTLKSLQTQYLTSAPREGASIAAILVAIVSNIANNLPVGLLAGRSLTGIDPHSTLPAAVLIGVDLGPNLSVTGSLATLLWLAALQREGLEMRARDFLRIGALAMPPALLLALGALLL